MCYIPATMDAIIFCVLLLTPQAAPPVLREVSSYTRADANKQKQQPQPDQPAAPAPSLQSTDKAKSDSDTSTSGKQNDKSRRVVIERLPDKDRWDKAYIVFTSILVGVGIVTLIAIWYQAVKTRDAAEAALLNAHALINTERAWVVVKEERTNTYSFRLTIENVGKTPAKLISNFLEVAILNRGQKLSPEPVYKTEHYEGLQPSLISPGDTRFIYTAAIQELNGSHPKDRWIRDVENGLFEIFFFGCVRYMDTLGNPSSGSSVHETRWCFKLIPVIRGSGASLVSHPYLFPNSYIDYT